MTNDPSQWTLEEFKSFLLVLASHADLEYSIQERQMILNLVPDEKLTEIEEFYYSLGDYQQVEFLQRARPHFLPDLESKEKLLALVAIQFTADERLSKMEIQLLTFLDRIL